MLVKSYLSGPTDGNNSNWCCVCGINELLLLLLVEKFSKRGPPGRYIWLHFHHDKKRTFTALIFSLLARSRTDVASWIPRAVLNALSA